MANYSSVIIQNEGMFHHLSTSLSTLVATSTSFTIVVNVFHAAHGVMLFIGRELKACESYIFFLLVFGRNVIHACQRGLLAVDYKQHVASTCCINMLHQHVASTC